MTAKNVVTELAKYEDPVRALSASRFFKTGKGQYGEGDVFIGVSVPDVRAVVKDFSKLSLSQIEELLESDIHEHRLAALIIMTNQAKKADGLHKKLSMSYICAEQIE